MPELRRNLNLPLIIFFGLGNILGAGVYLLVGKVAGEAGMYAPVAFLVTALVVTATALSYAELAARFPDSAGEAIYLHRGFGRKELSMLGGALIALTGTVSAATIVRGAVGYVQVYVPISDTLAIVGLTAGLVILAIWGIRQAVMTVAVFTVVEIFGLLLVVYVGAEALQTLPWRLPEMLPPMQMGAWMGILLGAFVAFYAFIGFEDMVNVAEEVKMPERNLPLGIIWALGLSTLLYSAVVLVAVLVVPPVELAQSKAPLSLVYEKATGTTPVLITGISLAAVLNGALIQIIMVSRLLFGMSRQSWLPASLGRINKKTHTPVISTLWVGVTALLLALWFPLVTLAKATSFIILIVFTLVNVSLVVIKLRKDTKPPEWSFPVIIPLLGAACNAGLLVLQSVLGEF